MTAELQARAQARALKEGQDDQPNRSRGLTAAWSDVSILIVRQYVSRLSAVTRVLLVVAAISLLVGILADWVPAFAVFVAVVLLLGYGLIRNDPKATTARDNTETNDPSIPPRW